MHVDHCPRHGEVETILAGGEYRDRKGREWSLWHDLTGGPSEWITRGDHRFEHPLTPDQMRLLIIREQHREVCPGLWDCLAHPVPHVIFGDEDGPTAHDPLTSSAVVCPTLTEAMDAARRMTGETP